MHERYCFYNCCRQSIVVVVVVVAVNDGLVVFSMFPRCFFEEAKRKRPRGRKTKILVC